MELTEDSFRALARSSPWRWRTLHFSRDDWGVEAWLRRPGRLLVKEHDGALLRESGPPIASSAAESMTVTPDMVSPDLRPDGLVRERPPVITDDRYIAYGDPMYENYTWVAALDPVELSHGTDIADLRDKPLRGRPTWWARVHAVDGYDPCCSCCALLWSEISDRLEYGSEEGFADRLAAAVYPDAYIVGLDVQTGVVVSLRSADSNPAMCTFEITIHEVDGPVDTGGAPKEIPADEPEWPDAATWRMVAEEPW